MFKKNITIGLAIFVILGILISIYFFFPIPRQNKSLEIGSTISFNIPLYIIEMRLPLVNIDDGVGVKYGLSCYKDRTKSDNELLVSNTELTITKIGHTQVCIPHGEGCFLDSFYIAKSQSGKLLQVAPHDITYNFNNCKERSKDYK